MEAVYYIDQNHIFSVRTGSTGYYVDRGYIYGRNGYTQHYIHDRHIYGPSGYTGCYLDHARLGQSTYIYTQTDSAPWSA